MRYKPATISDAPTTIMVTEISDAGSLSIYVLPVLESTVAL